MIGLDTNVLVRYIVQDDPEQAARAGALIEAQCSDESPGFVSMLVLAELCWVLSKGYGYDRPVLEDVLTNLLTTTDLVVEQAADAWAALQDFKRGPADYTDYLIGRRGLGCGCKTTYTFDRKAARSKLHSLVQ